MRIESVLSSLEKYLELKKDAGDSPDVGEARIQASNALDEYIQHRFDDLMFAERQKGGRITKKVVVPDVGSIKFTWDDIVHLIDALNSAPGILSDQHLRSAEAILRWMDNYKEWYFNKRLNAINVISPTLDLDLDDDLKG